MRVPVVADVGCATYTDEESRERLIGRFNPDVYYGIDPFIRESPPESYGDTKVVMVEMAAWTHDGECSFHQDESRSVTSDVSGLPTVPCFDLANWMLVLGKPVVLKLDAEGAEYRLLERMIDTGADKNVTLLLVEWHEVFQTAGWKDSILGRLSCPVEAWTW